MRVLVAGDYCPQNRVTEAFDKDDYASVLGEVKKMTSHADYSIVNLECPVFNGGAVPLKKSGPNLCCSEKGIDALKWGGFDCVTLANNHFCDYGEEGVKNTLKTCADASLEVVGGGLTLKSASAILYKKIRGVVLAIINCCEHEFSIASDTSCGSNPLNPIRQYYSIKEARNEADYVLIIVHGGNEHCPFPSLRMQETYRFFIDSGADAVINHHQHCVNGYEIYKGRPIFYGLGNFCFDNNLANKDSWYLGYMVVLEFKTLNDVDYSIIPYHQCDNVSLIRPLNEDDKNNFVSYIEKLNSIIINPSLLNKEWENWVKTSGKWIMPMFEPWQTRITMALFNHGLLPSKLKGGRKRLLENIVNCESHLDRLRYLLNKEAY